MKNIDLAYTELCKERKKTRTKLIAPAQWFKRSINDDGEANIEYDEESEVYQLAKDFSQDAEPFAFSPEYCIEESY